MASGYGKQFNKNKKTVRANNLQKHGSYTCEYCGKSNLQTLVPNTPDFVTIDHFVPLSQGGKHGLYNLRLSCHECNAKKGSESFDIFSISSLINVNQTSDERSEAG